MTVAASAVMRACHRAARVTAAPAMALRSLSCEVRDSSHVGSLDQYLYVLGVGNLKDFLSCRQSAGGWFSRGVHYLCHLHPIALAFRTSVVPNKTPHFLRVCLYTPKSIGVPEG